MRQYYEKKYRSTLAKLNEMKANQRTKIGPLHDKVKELASESRDLSNSCRDAVSWALNHLKQVPIPCAPLHSRCHYAPSAAVILLTLRSASPPLHCRYTRAHCHYAAVSVKLRLS